MPWAHLFSWLLAGVAMGALATVLVIWVRRMAILGHRPGTFRCRVGVTPAGPWRRGLAQYSSDRLSWWPRFSLGGSEHWPRADLQVVKRAEFVNDPDGDRALVLTCTVIDDGCTRDLYLLVEAGAAAGLTSWLEATPSRRNNVI